MEINISKRDVFWSYVAQFLQLASGIIVLPYVLRKLSADEVGLNYIFLTIGSLVNLMDFGFSPQFARNISYIYGGAQSLQKKGLSCTETNDINYRLLATMIKVAEKVYFYLSLSVLIVIGSLGSVYIYYVTDGFHSILNVKWTWCVFCLSTFFNIYFSYYISLLTGSGQIKESKYATIVSRIVYIILCVFFLYIGLSLLGLCIANLVAPFALRWMSYHFYFSKELKDKITLYNVSKKEIKNTFSIIWYNAKRLGINAVGAYAITKIGLFLSGLYLSLEDVSSYGLMIQFFGIVSTISIMFFNVSVPQFATLRVKGEIDKLISKFALTIDVFYVLYGIGTIFVIFIIPCFLDVIGSNSKLPSTFVLFIYGLAVLLEQNHSAFATLIVTSNDVPFVKAGLLSGLFITLSSYINLQFFNYGIMGLVVVQLLCQLAYNNWKWPKLILDEFHISYLYLISSGVKQIRSYGCKNR